MLFADLLQQADLAVKQELEALLADSLEVHDLDRHGAAGAFVAATEDLAGVAASESFGRVVAVVLYPFSEGLGK